MNQPLKLSEYAAQVCDALEANPKNEQGEPNVVTVTFHPAERDHRLFISNVIRNAFCTQGAYASDALFFHFQNMSVANMQLSQQLQALSKVENKPKRTIQSAPKKGTIPKAKIEKAVKKVLAPKKEFTVED